MLFRSLLAGLALATAATDLEAGPFRRRTQPTYQPVYQPPMAVTPAGGTDTSPVPSAVSPAGYVSGYSPAVTPAAMTTGDAAGADGLDEVNAQRAARGLRPFLRDEGLAQAALSCAQFRADSRLSGHTSNDFAFVPPGTFARSAGCAAAPAYFGWLSCCTYENYTYGGAAWAAGRDGQRYMHLFVR